MRFVFTTAVLAGLSLAAPAAMASNVQFNITSGIVCQLEGPCQTNDQAFFDVVPTSFIGAIQPDGTFIITDTISLSFDNASQFIDMSVAGGVLGPEAFNPPVVDGEIPSGQWLGSFDFVASNGSQGSIVLGTNTGQTFFIDNFEQAFNFSLMATIGTTSINFFVSGDVELQPVPIPGALPLLLAALAPLLTVRRRRARS